MTPAQLDALQRAHRRASGDTRGDSGAQPAQRQPGTVHDLLTFSAMRRG
jgi:hypothetical protein